MNPWIENNDGLVAFFNLLFFSSVFLKPLHMGMAFVLNLKAHLS